MLKNLTDWKLFEKLCADLLEAEGFVIESEPRNDTTGFDLVATEHYRSHDPARSIAIRWLIQCKHYAGSGKSLDRREVDETLNAYGASRSAGDGLFLIVSTDYTEPAKRSVDRYVEKWPGARVMLWNSRQLIAKLARHPELIRRYGLHTESPPPADIFAGLGRFSDAQILFVSDQSAFAHDLASKLRGQGLQLIFLPVWNYSSDERISLFLSAYATARISLVVLFLGDSFRVKVPARLEAWISRLHDGGTSLLMMPFVAWTIAHHGLTQLSQLSPAELSAMPEENTPTEKLQRLIGETRKGDFSWLGDFDSFAEDRFVEYDPVDGSQDFIEGLSDRFGLSHSFEYLQAANGADVRLTDTTGNPLIITRERRGVRAAYVNSCCHACLSTTPISSPIETSKEFSTLIANVCGWLLAAPSLQNRK